jgi:photosystem II stability/assembly factor-like uncharacterized protein
VLVATDRSGVMVSDNAGQTFRASNAGYSHRQVSSFVVDRNDPRTAFAAVLNDKEFGGVFVTHNDGNSWMQISDGLAGRDVFHMAQAADGTLVAGTNGGVFLLEPNSRIWHSANTVVVAKAQPQPKPRRLKSGKIIAAKPLPPVYVKSQLNARVTHVDISGDRWLLTSTKGIFVSHDHGRTWMGGAVLGETDFIGAHSFGDTITAATTRRLVVSNDDGKNWNPASMPAYVSVIYNMTYAPDGTLWLATREGAFRSNDGRTWIHALEGLPPKGIREIAVDHSNRRLLATAVDSSVVYETQDGGKNCKQLPDAGLYVRGAYNLQGRLVVATAYNGLMLLEAKSARESESRSQSVRVGGGSQ